MGSIWSTKSAASSQSAPSAWTSRRCRYPDRLYTLRESSVSFNWNAGDWFNVTGIVDWTCSSPERQQTSVGSQQFTFGLHREPAGGFTIIKEDGQVISRTVSKAPEAVYQPKQ
jgi:hypothetical protein